MTFVGNYKYRDVIPEIIVSIGGYIRVLMKSAEQRAVCFANVIRMIVSIENINSQTFKRLKTLSKQPILFYDVEHLSRPHARILNNNLLFIKRHQKYFLYLRIS